MDLNSEPDDGPSLPAEQTTSSNLQNRFLPLVKRIASTIGRGLDVEGLYLRCIQHFDSHNSDRGEAGSLDDAKQAKHQEVLWRACSLYLVKAVATALSQPSNLPADPAVICPSQHSNVGIPIADVCIAGDVSPYDFMEQLPVVAGRLQPLMHQWLMRQPAEGGAHTLNLENIWAIRQWERVMKDNEMLARKLRELLDRSLVPGATQEGGLVLLRKWAWLLFINLKALRLPMFADRVSCMELLVLVVNTVVTQLPSCKWLLGANKRRRLNMLQSASAAPDDGPPLVTLDTLADMAHCDREAVHSSAADVDATVLSLMEAATDGWRLCKPVNHPQDGMIITACSYFDGLFSNGAIQYCCEQLDSTYCDRFLKHHGELDERMFLQSVLVADVGRNRARPPPLRVEGAGSTTVPAWQSSGVVPVAGRVAMSGHALGQSPRPMSKPPFPESQRRGPMMLHSPMPVAAFGLDVATPRTPMTATMNSNLWLRRVQATTKLQPSPRLVAFFDACDRDVGPVLMKRVGEMALCVVPNGNGPQEQHWAEERRTEGIKLYYRALEAMLLMEREHTMKTQASAVAPSSGEINLTRLLTSFTFHKCVAAFAFEMVIASHSISALAFPEVLNRLHLKAFDFCNLIERFVRCEPDLPFELKRHMFQIEEEIIEKLAWRPRSSLYALLLAAAPPRVQATAKDDPTPPPHAATASADAGNCADAASTPGPPCHSLSSTTLPEDSSTPVLNIISDIHSKPNLSLATPAPAAHSSATSPPASVDLRTVSPDLGPTPIATPATSALSSSPAKRSAMSTPETNSSPSKRQKLFSGATELLPGAAEIPYPTAVGAPDSAAAGADNNAVRVVHEFFRRVLKLCAFRLAELCEKLEVETLDKQTLATRVYYIFQHALYHHTYLLYNRHMDQILLCCLYGFCKVKKVPNVSFREITNHYKKGNKSNKEGGKEEVFRNVVLKQVGANLEVLDAGDIIAFYNQVFVPAMKGHLLKTVHDSGFTAGQQVPSALQTAFQARQSPKPIMPHPILWEAGNRQGPGGRGGLDTPLGPSPRPRVPLPRMPPPASSTPTQSQGMAQSLAQRRPAIFLQDLNIPSGPDHSEIPIISPAAPPTSAH